MKIKISLAQIIVNYADLNANLDKALLMINEANENGSDFILLPEFWSSGYDLTNMDYYIKPNKDITSKFDELSKKLNMAIGGSLLEKRGRNFYNTFNLHTPDNSLPIKYEKIHLIPQMDETKWLSPGKELAIHKNETFCAGLMICYDIRFPELTRKYVIDKKINLLLVVAQWPQLRIDHWIALLQARAIENQIFIAAANAVGDSGGIKLGGNSCILDPWGRVLISGNDKDEALLAAELDLSDVDEIRSSFPVLNDRRKDIY